MRPLIARVTPDVCAGHASVQESHGYCERCRTWVQLAKKRKVATPTPMWFKHSHKCRLHYMRQIADLTTVSMPPST